MKLTKESGSTSDVSTASTWNSSLGTTEDIATEEAERYTIRRALISKAWKAAARPYALAVVMPFAEIEQSWRITGANQIVVRGAWVTDDNLEYEDEFVMRRKHSTLWLSSVPILPRRRPFIPLWDSADDPGE